MVKRLVEAKQYTPSGWAIRVMYSDTYFQPTSTITGICGYAEFKAWLTMDEMQKLMGPDSKITLRKSTRINAIKEIIQNPLPSWAPSRLVRISDMAWLKRKNVVKVDLEPDFDSILKACLFTVSVAPGTLEITSRSISDALDADVSVNGFCWSVVKESGALVISGYVEFVTGVTLDHLKRLFGPGGRFARPKTTRVTTIRSIMDESRCVVGHPVVSDKDWMQDGFTVSDRKVNKRNISRNWLLRITPTCSMPTVAAVAAWMEGVLNGMKSVGGYLFCESSDENGMAIVDCYLEYNYNISIDFLMRRFGSDCICISRTNRRADGRLEMLYACGAWFLPGVVRDVYDIPKIMRFPKQNVSPGIICLSSWDWLGGSGNGRIPANVSWTVCCSPDEIEARLPPNTFRAVSRTPCTYGYNGETTVYLSTSTCQSMPILALMQLVVFPISHVWTDNQRGVYWAATSIIICTTARPATIWPHATEEQLAWAEKIIGPGCSLKRPYAALLDEDVEEGSLSICD